MKLAQVKPGSHFQTLQNYHTGSIPIPAGTKCLAPTQQSATAMLAVTVDDPKFPHGAVTFAMAKTSDVCSEEELATLA